jgi:transcriptional regulator with XRE-family HTH domain
MPVDDYELLKKLGDNIKSIRESKLMTQSELGFHCDLEKSTVSKFELGKGNPTFRTLLKIAKALDVSLTTLFQV